MGESTESAKAGKPGQVPPTAAEAVVVDGKAGASQADDSSAAAARELVSALGATAQRLKALLAAGKRDVDCRDEVRNAVTANTGDRPRLGHPILTCPALPRPGRDAPAGGRGPPRAGRMRRSHPLCRCSRQRQGLCAHGAAQRPWALA